MDISCHTSCQRDYLMLDQINGYQLSASCQTNYLMLDQINGYQLSLIMSKKLSYVGPNSSISSVSHHVKPIILCWTKLMDISCHSSCQTNYLMLDQIHGYQLSVTRQTNYLVLDQINGYQLTLIMSKKLFYVGPNS